MSAYFLWDVFRYNRSLILREQTCINVKLVSKAPKVYLERDGWEVVAVRHLRLFSSRMGFLRDGRKFSQAGVKWPNGTLQIWKFNQVKKLGQEKLFLSKSVVKIIKIVHDVYLGLSRLCRLNNTVVPIILSGRIPSEETRGNDMFSGSSFYL